MALVPLPESCTHVLAEFDCLDPLLSALRLDSGRLKCTCLAVSRKWLALGTSAGGLHLIQKEDWKQKLILTHKEGSITQVACCPHDEDFVAVATSQGLVVVWELQLERRGRPERVGVSWEHRGRAVTGLCWDSSTLRVFVGDSGGKVSCLRAGSSKVGKGPFVIFPVQTVATVDSRVVQLGYQDGRLLVSSLSRCYLCDTEREKFWRIGNKERDGEYGACFFPLNRGPLQGQPPLLYCARPGSRMWEVNFSGEVLSTHQFKQLLACPPLPVITHRKQPRYDPEQKRSQSVAFSRLLHLGDQSLLSWTHSAVYVFTPQSGQVLLWTEVKDIQDIAAYRNELFCLHGNGRLSHFLLLSVERCVERLLRRESWPLAARVCCMFQHAVTTSRARKHVPIERLEQLRSQLGSSADLELCAQLEEVIGKLEPSDSASSSRRSSISSHESFNVLDCGIYRVISRRGSQSEEETGSLVNHSASEEERLKELGFAPEEDPADHDPQSGERVEAERSDQGLPFHLPLSFRHKPPRIALQAVKDSVSSFVKKTTEKINTLQMNSELRQKPESREGGQADATAAPLEDSDSDVNNEPPSAEADMQELRAATERAAAQVLDPSVLLDPACLTRTLLDWLPALERVLGPAEAAAAGDSHPDGPGDGEWDGESPTSGSGPAGPVAGDEKKDDSGARGGKEDRRFAFLNWSPPEPVRLEPPRPVQAELLSDLARLATLYAELSCFRKLPPGAGLGCAAFLRRYFFLLDDERVRRMCLLAHREQPELQASFVEAMLGVTRSSKVVEDIHRGNLLKSLRSLRELQPWSAPPLLAHLHRLYEKHGEAAVRSFSQFYPTVTPADVAVMAQRSHFLAYLDNLVQSQSEEHRLVFLQSLLEPESQKHDWLEAALTHDAPQPCDTMTPEGKPRWHSHRFSWGYGRLLALLIRLPADLPSKQKMAESCRSHGYWAGYLWLCRQLQQRAEAFSTICHLDDIGLLEEPEGVEPETLEEWKLLIRLSQQHGGEVESEQVNGSSWSDGSQDGGRKINPESLTLMLARTAGPDPAMAVLEECGVQPVLSPASELVFELLRVTEKRQRAMIQMMLERCDRFLWSQHA